MFTFRRQSFPTAIRSLTIGAFFLSSLTAAPAFSIDNSDVRDSGSASDVGREIYMTNCVTCHGPSGQGDGPAAVAMPKSPPRNFVRDGFKYGSSVEELFNTITNGVTGTPMPPWSALSEEQRRAVAEYVRSFHEK